jgi:hypothetical protein
VPDVRWDLYAIGAILYCLVVGNPPHRNDDTVGKIDTASDLKARLALYRQAIQTALPPTEHRRIPGMDRALAEIIDRDALEARDLTRSRLPLMVLGFVGPLLVLLVTGFFSYRGYQRAVIEAEEGYRSWALENNQFAASLAAEKVTAEIGRYFEIARDEAKEPELLPLLIEVLASSSLDRLSDPQIKEADIEPARERFRGEAARLKLDEYLMRRLRAYDAAAKRDSRSPRFASIFLTDRYGTQIAAAFDDDSPGDSIGENRAFRTYFHGGPSDVPPLPRVQLNGKHIERTHLSGVFQSTTQKTWKVAISTPIFREADGGKQFEGILALTVHLGDFEVSQSAMPSSRDRFAVLVDGRAGDEQGTILQHPLFE